MSSNPKIEALLQACDALSQDLDPLLAELVKDQDQRRIDALISLFDAASTLDPDLFGDRIDRIGEAKVSCDSAYHDVCDELDALASVALTPAQDQLLSDLFDRGTERRRPARPSARGLHAALDQSSRAAGDLP
jgi:hypothetical protein